MWCCRRKHTSIYGTVLVEPDVKLCWSTVIPEGTLVREKIDLRSPDEDRTLYKLWYPGPMKELTYDESLELFYLNLKRPWVWIGGEGRNMMDEVEEYVVPGNRITLKVLNMIANIHWQYCSAETLEILDFPSEGFIIDDPRIKPDQKEE
jgi:hypothetical protein